MLSQASCANILVHLFLERGSLQTDAPSYLIVFLSRKLRGIRQERTIRIQMGMAMIL